jgi:hypothetical protein
LSPKRAQPAATARTTESRRARRQRWRTNKKEGIAIAPTPYTAEIVSALVELHYLNDESASPPAVGVAIGEAIAALLGERILQMRLRRSTNSRRKFIA